jgi:hypothetical protein
MKSASLIIAAVLAASPVSAACIAVAPGLPGWQTIDFDGIAPNTWSAEGDAISVSSNASASLLYAAVPASSGSTLTWRWRVDQGVPATDLTRKGGDDRSVALTVGFAYDSANASFGERMKRTVVEAVAGADAPGRIIEFVWGGNQQQGARAVSPYSGSSGQIVTLRTSDSPGGNWQAERVDVSGLYREIWGSEAPPITRIALTADSDDTRTAIAAKVSDICIAD